MATTASEARASAPATAPKSDTLRNVLALAKRELGFYFNSPIAYIVIALFLVVSGLMQFVFDVPDMGTDFFAANEANLRGLFGPTGPESFGGIPLLFVFLIPAVTMRLVAEEKRTGTIELLVTWPVTDAQIVVG
jgi:ABC-2 type transport system permease protein